MYIIFVHLLYEGPRWFSLAYIFFLILTAISVRLTVLLFQAILKQCKHEIEQMLLKCYKIMSISLKKEQEFVSFALSCSVSLAAQSVWSMLELRLSFFNSSVAGLSQYFTVLSQVVNYCSVCDSSVNKYLNTSDENFYIDNGTSLSSSSSSSESSFSPQVNRP